MLDYFYYDFARDFYQEEPEELELFCLVMKIKPSLLKSSFRNAEIVILKKLYCVWSSKLVEQIAKDLNYKDHSTVVYHRQSHRKYMNNPKYRRLFNQMQEKLK